MSRSFKRLLVAGGAGFIGSNFVRLLRKTRPEVEITVLDKLTYAGNPANLAEFDGTIGYTFVHGDICDRRLVDSVAAGVDAITRSEQTSAAGKRKSRVRLLPLDLNISPSPSPTIL